MNNLKRVLSTVLAGTMLAGMMVVGASAAGFPDADKIEHTEAVNTLTALNVISGKEDGNYDPEGSLTRAEMAKLAVFILHGGKDPVLGVKATPTYSDIDNNWAESYIEYCSAIGIIAGMGDGTFGPNTTLTGSQAAKMLLVAMNYDAKIFGFSGTVDWETNVNVEANKAGLYDGLEGMDPSQTITRDQAAQLVYNAIQAPTMKLSWNQNMSNGSISQQYDLIGASLFASKFNGVVYEGVLTTSGEYSIDASGAKNFIEIANVQKINGKAPAAATAFSTTLEDTDLTGLVGQYVKVLANTKNDNIYGVYAVDSKNTVVETTANKVALSSGKLSVAGTKYNFNDTAVIVNGTAGATISSYFSTTAPAKADNVIVISNDGDEKIDLVLVNTTALAKVNYVGTTAFSITKLSGTRAQGAGAGAYTAANQKFEDVNAPENLAKGDLVVISEDYYTGTDTYTVIETVSGTVEGTKDGQWMIDGAWYKPYAGDGSDNLDASIKSGDTVDYVAFNGIVYFAKKTSGVATVDNIAMVITTGTTAADTNLTTGTYKAKLIFPDGTKATVPTVDINGNPVDTSNTLVGKLVSYEKTGSGAYILTAITSATGTDYDGYIANNVATTGTGTTITKVNTTDIADDAIVFVWKGANADTQAAANDAKVLTGKEAKTLTKNDYDAKAVQALVSKVNGYDYVKVMTLFNDSINADLPGTFEGRSYGYLVADAYKTYDAENTTSYRNMKIWNGSEVITVREKGSSLTNLTAGAVITYNVVDSTEIKDVKVLTPAVEQVNGYDAEAEKMSVVGIGSNDITKNTVIFYVDSANKVGYTEGTIAIADDTSANGSIGANDQANVRVIAGSGATAGEWEFILVDVNNKMSAAPAMILASGASAADVKAALKSSNSVTVNGGFTASSVAIEDGKTLTVKGALANYGEITIKNGGTLKVETVGTQAQHNALKKEAGAVLVTKGTSDNVATADGFFATNATALNGVVLPEGTYTYYAAGGIETGSAAGWYTATAVKYVLEH